MKAGSSNINSIFNGSRLLQIPFFQRSYVWERPLLERFLESMEEASIPNKSYFLGTLILKQSSTTSNSGVGDIRTVIDGQQRLTTLLLFLKILCVKSDQIGEFNRIAIVRGKLSILHNFFDRDCFEEIMKQDDLQQVHYKTRLADAYNFFLEKVDVEKFDLFNILDNILFVAIDLQQDENEQVIFDTINSLGVNLTTGELLKNFVFSEQTIDKYNEIWKPVFEKDEDTINYWNQKTTLGRLQRINLETFLYAYLHIKINDPALNISSADKSRFRSAEDLFNQYKHYIQLVNVDLIDFARDLTEYAKLYRQNITSSCLDEEIPKAWGIERINAIIFGMDTTTMIPYILYVLKNQHDLTEVNDICRVLESYVMRRIICRSGNDNYSDLFSLHLITNQILSSSELIEYLIRKDGDSSLAMPNDDNLYHSIIENKLSNPRAKGVLYFLESLIRDEYHGTALRPFSSYSLEHLMPKKWTEASWPLTDGYDAETRNDRLATLGNLSILPTKLNVSISNRAWTVKLNGNGQRKGLRHYATGIETLSRWLESENWDERRIEDRAKWLFSKAHILWQFGPNYHSSSISTVSLFDSEPLYSELTIDANETDTVYLSHKESEIDEHNSKRDTTKFFLNGSNALSKRDFVFQVIKYYIEQNPQTSFEELKRVFPDSIIDKKFVIKGLIASVDVLLDGSMSEKELNKRYNFNKEDKCLNIGGVELFVNTQHTIDSANRMFVVAKQLGYDVSSTNSVIITSDENQNNVSSTKSADTILKISLPNGRVIFKPKAIDSLEEFVKYIGVKRVATLDILAYQNFRLVTTSFISLKHQKQVGEGFYLFKNSSTFTKKQQIEQIISLLHLDNIKVEIVEK